MKKKLLDNIHYVGLFLLFLGMCLFYIRMHPMYLTSPDDWTYVSYSRQAWPMKGAWNPGKILPETIGGLIGDFSAFVVYPIIKDYIKAFSVTYGVAFALLVSLYLYAFSGLLRKCFDLDGIQTLVASFIFFVLHFQITKVKLLGNNYLFNTFGINLGINYFMPMMFGAGLALLLMKKVAVDDYLNSHYGEEKTVLGEFTSLRNGFLFLLLYLSIFSNLIISGIFMAFIGSAFIYRLCQDIRSGKKHKFKEWIIRYLPYLAAFAMDLICAVAELTGGNADLHDDVTLAGSIAEYPSQVLKVLEGINKPTAFIILVLVVLALDLSVAPGAVKSEAKRFRVMLWLSIASLVINFCYVSLISLRVGGYLSKPRVYNGMLIWVVIIAGISCAYIIRRVAGLRAFYPIVVFVLFFVMLNVPDDIGNGFGLGDRLYGDNAAMNQYYDEDTSLVEQFIAADKSGTEEFTLYSNGAIGEYGQWAAYRVRRTLLRHGLIDRVMEVNVEKRN